MNRAEKQDFVTELTHGIQDAKAFALMSFSNLSVEQMTSFRLGLVKQNITVKVLKNTLAKRVLGSTLFKDLCSHLSGPNLIAYGQDPVVTAKALVEWSKKEGFNLKLKGGAALGQIMSDAQLTALSKLPGRNDLYVNFLWALKNHPTRFLYALQHTTKKLGYALQALKTKKETEPA